MRLENSFEVDAAQEVAWRLLNDVPKVLPCMPGAELLEIVGENAWKAKLQVKLGPIALQFVADVARERVDEDARLVALVVKAREAKGRGTAEAHVTSSISSAGDGTRVDLVTDLELRGAVAQHARGVIAQVASTVTAQFADCLAHELANAPAEPRTPTPSAINGVGLLLRSIWRAVRGARRRP
jgi:carbon monoxide dehydrogenase subunit G